MSSLLSALLAVAGLLTVNGAAFTSSRCAAGPSYWCSNILAAKECYAMQYCLDNNWAADKQVTKVSEDPQACSLCKKLIKDTRTFLSANSTIEMVEQYLAQACELFTDDFMVNECKTIEDHYLKQALAQVLANLDPETVCTAAHICDSEVFSSHDFFIEQMFRIMEEHVGTDYCALCEETVGYMHTLAGLNGTKERIENVLLTQVCPELKEKSLIDMCTKTVQSSFPEIWDAVVAALNDSKALCTEFGYCSSQRLVVPDVKQAQPAKSLQSIANGSVCDICKDAVALVERELEDAKTKAVPALEQLCQQLGPLADRCEALANQTLDAIFQAADQVFNNESCVQWNLCDSNRCVSKSGYGDANCDMCKKMISNMYVLASKEGTEDYVKNLILDQGCAKMKKESERLECKLAVEAAFSDIWKDVLAGLQNPNGTCATLGFCTSARLNNILAGKAQNIPWYRKY